MNQEKLKIVDIGTIVFSKNGVAKRVGENFSTPLL